MTATPPHHPTRSRLAPEDAYLTRSSTNDLPSSSDPNTHHARPRHPHRSRSRRRRDWKKLLWFKQSYPDNYTDEYTFLGELERNPRLRPYDFWPLVADSTVIVQQVCTMIVFMCCFSGIMQERVSPVTVVTIGTVSTVLGWVLWDYWVGQEEEGELQLQREREEAATKEALQKEKDVTDDSLERSLTSGSTTSFAKDGGQAQGLGLKLSLASSASSAPSAPAPAQPPPKITHSRQTSSTSLRHQHQTSKDKTTASTTQTPKDLPPSHQSPNTTISTPNPQNNTTPTPPPTTRSTYRLQTFKSATLITFSLLGLSPILKSLTKSTASDSIWAIAFWLMLINVIFFDYGGGVGATFPASLSTNAALMACTVLASRLAVGEKSGEAGSDDGWAGSDAQSTAHVFSLTLFSIEVFGLFPVFRRYLRHVSWGGHLSLTWFLVMSAGAGVTMILSGGGLIAAIVGAILGSGLTGLAMGMCAWWLIGLQRFKNEIHGPWDPARPIIRRWD